MRGLLLLGLTTALWGCVLETEACGPDYLSDQGRCVPVEAPPPYYPPSAGPDGGAPDAGPPPVALPPADGYGAYDRVRVVDTSPPAAISARVGTPGADLDAVLAVGPGGELGFGVEVVQDATDDNDGRRRAGDPGAALGEPDAADDGDVGRFISLGAGGSLTLQLPFAVFSGVTLEIYEAAGSAADTYRVEICRGDTAPPDGCLVVASDLSEIGAIRLP